MPLVAERTQMHKMLWRIKNDGEIFQKSLTKIR